VNDRTMPAKNAALSANTVDFHDRCSLEMDQAIGNEKSSLDITTKASWFAPVDRLFKAASQAIGFCVGMHRSWLSLLVPHVSSHRSTVASNSGGQSKPSPDELAYSVDVAIGPQHGAALKSTAASSSVTIAQPQPTPDDLAYSMDIAIGERFTVQSRTVENSSGRQAPAAELPESSKGLAMAATAGN
jgi:hypothetical protein